MSGQDKCPRCGAERTGSYSYECGSYWSGDGHVFRQSDRCKIAERDATIATLQAELAARPESRGAASMQPMELTVEDAQALEKAGIKRPEATELATRLRSWSDAYSKCSMCGQLEPACPCAHPDTTQWKPTPESEMFDYAADAIDRLTAEKKTDNKTIATLRRELVSAMEALAGGVGAIAFERRRQIDAEGWSNEHDDEHNKGELSRAAACYAVGTLEIYAGRLRGNGTVDMAERVWPWSPECDKRRKHTRVRQLEIAGALIAAELDRLVRGGHKLSQSVSADWLREHPEVK